MKAKRATVMSDVTSGGRSFGVFYCVSWLSTAIIRRKDGTVCRALAGSSRPKPLSQVEYGCTENVERAENAAWCANRHGPPAVKSSGVTEKWETSNYILFSTRTEHYEICSHCVNSKLIVQYYCHNVSDNWYFTTICCNRVYLNLRKLLIISYKTYKTISYSLCTFSLISGLSHNDVAFHFKMSFISATSFFRSFHFCIFHVCRSTL